MFRNWAAKMMFFLLVRVIPISKECQKSTRISGMVFLDLWISYQKIFLSWSSYTNKTPKTGRFGSDDFPTASWSWNVRGKVLSLEDSWHPPSTTKRLDKHQKHQQKNSSWHFGISFPFSMWKTMKFSAGENCTCGIPWWGLWGQLVQDHHWGMETQTVNEHTTAAKKTKRYGCWTKNRGGKTPKSSIKK